MKESKSKHSSNDHDRNKKEIMCSSNRSENNDYQKQNEIDTTEDTTKRNANHCNDKLNSSSKYVSKLKDVSSNIIESSKLSSTTKDSDKQMRTNRHQSGSSKDKSPKRTGSSTSRSNSSQYNNKRHRKHSRSYHRHTKDKTRHSSRSRHHRHESSRRQREDSYSNRKDYKSRSRSKARDKYSRRHHHHRSRSPSEKKKEVNINKFYEERKRVRERSRSNSALRVMKMKNLENACGYYQRFYQRPHEDNDPNKPQLYWDGYQWVIKPTNATQSNYDSFKPGRKVQIANVPLHLNIQVTNFKEFLNQKLIEKNVISRRDVKDINTVIRAIEFEIENNTAIVVMESIDIAKRMVLLDGLILLGHTLRFSPYKEVNTNDVSLVNINKEAALANSAHLSAKSAAISYAAFQSIFNKKETVHLNFSTGESKVSIPSSRIVKIMGLVNINDNAKVQSSPYNEIMDDIKDEFEKFGHIVSAVIIKPGKEKMGGEVGAMFIEFQEMHSAEKCVLEMKGRKYEGHELKVTFIDETVFRTEIIE